MSKPIEVGCKAIYAHAGGGIGDNYGTVLIVGKFIGKVKGFVGEDRWEIDAPLKACGSVIYHSREVHLHRIDDDDEASWEIIAETVGWIPKVVETCK